MCLLPNSNANPARGPSLANPAMHARFNYLRFVIHPEVAESKSK